MNLRFSRSALAIVAGALASVIAPSARLAPSAWAQAHLVVPDGPQADKLWDASLTPYIVEPLDMLAMDSGVNEIAVRKSAQTGFTMMLLAGTAYLIDQDPCRIMIVEPTTAMRSDLNRDKLVPAIEKTDVIRARVKDQVSRGGGASTVVSKVYPGGSLTLAIASSAADLRSKTIKVALLDEIDEYPDDLDGQGDPLSMVEARQESFLMSGEWKRAYVSTPTIKGASKIDKAFDKGDQRYWFMACPGCGEPFRFLFDRKHFRFEESHPFSAHYATPCCGSIVESGEKVALMKTGRWIATAPKPGAYPSYHFDALTSPFVPWEVIAERYVNAKDDPQKLKAFENLTLGQAFDMKGDAPDHVQLMARRDGDLKRGHIPPLGLVLVGAADVQMNGIWYVIKAYGPDRQSWRVDAGYIAGATDDPHNGAFLGLEEIRSKRWPNAFGEARTVDAFGVDSGYRSHIVYVWVRGKPATFALKGLDGWSRPAIGQPTPVDIDFGGKRIRNGAMVWGVGTWPLKGAFYADLRKQQAVLDGTDLQSPPGYCHFGTWMDEVYFRQITSEYLGNENYRGRIRRVWMVRKGEENHLLDCEIYGAALADYLGVSRMTAAEWGNLASLRNVPEDVRLPSMFAPVPMQAQRPPSSESAATEAEGIWSQRSDSFWS